MVSQSAPTRTGDESAAEASAALEELIAELGLRTVLSAVLASSLAPHLSRTGEATLRVIQVILRQIAYAPNPQLEAEIMALGCGVILFDEQGCRHFARKHGLTPAAVSKRVIEFAEANALPPSQYMRSLQDRRTYALTNRPRIAAASK